MPALQCSSLRSALITFSVTLLLTASATAAEAKSKLDVKVTRIGDCVHKAKKGDMIYMNYRGTLKDNGQEFDSSYPRGQPFGFHLGFGEVIKGWDEGLDGVCLGEARTLIIPATLGYGDRGAPPDIPGGATLVFTTECVGINEFQIIDVSSVDSTTTQTVSSSKQTSTLHTSTTGASLTIATAPADPPFNTTTKEEELSNAILPPDLPVTDIPPAPPKDESTQSAYNEDADNGECELLGPFALLIQGALGALALLSMVYKRWRETPRRPVKIWAFDVSKQVIGSVLLHILNLLMSMLSSGQFDVARAVKPDMPLRRRADGFVQDDTAAPIDRPNPCSFYLLNLAIDTTIGIPILVVFLRILHLFFSYTALANPPESIRSGNYGQPPRATWWLKQCFIYFIGLFGMKLCVYFIFQLFPWIAWVGDWALQWTEGNEALQVAFVMLVFPLIMNVFQYWIIDSFIKDPAGGDGHQRIPQDDPRDADEERRRSMESDRSESSDGLINVIDVKETDGPLEEANPTPIPIYNDASRGGSSSLSTTHMRSA